MFWVAAAAAALFAIVLRSRLPDLPAHSGITYTDLMSSMWTLVVDVPKLRHVSLVAAMFFASFSAF